MSISITAPLEDARAWTSKMLFEKADPKRWFALGFCAWLAMIGRGGGSYNWTNSLRQGGGFDEDFGGGSGLTESSPLFGVTDSPALFGLAIGAIVVIAVIAVVLILVLLWLNSRGAFMFLDGVVRNEVRIGGSWTEYGPQANSLFRWQLLLGLGFLTILGLTALVVFGLFWGGTGSDGAPSLVALMLLFAVIAVAAIAYGLVQFAINDLVIPLMYLRRCTLGPAWREAMGLVSAHTAELVLYLLFRIVIGVAVFVVTLLSMIFTCCIAALPYIGTVIRLPLYVFVRSYNLYFLSQFGGDLARFAQLGEGGDDLAEVFE